MTGKTLNRILKINADILSVLLVVTMITGCKEKSEYVAPPPPTVTVSTPVQQTVTNYAEFTGSTEAVEMVEIRARVEGYLQSIHFEPRARVEKDDLLFIIDPKPLQAKLDEVEADLLIRKAELKLTETTLKRKEGAFKDKAVSEVEVIQARAERDKARAAIAASRATIRTARLNLSYTEVRSPVSGRISRNMVDVGNLVGAGERTLLAAIVKDDPIYAYFNVSERNLLEYRQKYWEKQIPIDEQGRVFICLGLANEAGYPHEGRIDYLNIRVDATTGTIQVRGLFPNPKHVLLPGLFVRIRVPVGILDNALLIPNRALGIDQRGYYLLVVNDQDVVEYRSVTIGVMVDGMRIINGGILPDDRVIVKGLQRARPGIVVKSVNG